MVLDSSSETTLFTAAEEREDSSSNDTVTGSHLRTAPGSQWQKVGGEGEDGRVRPGRPDDRANGGTITAGLLQLTSCSCPDAAITLEVD